MHKLWYKNLCIFLLYSFFVQIRQIIVAFNLRLFFILINTKGLNHRVKISL